MPLFEKIEQSRLEELKMRYGGPQVEPEQPNEQNEIIRSIEDAEKAIAVQGNKIRAMKTSKEKHEKSAIQEQVKILLDLKNLHAKLQKKC